jgi:hypothetical protein
MEIICLQSAFMAALPLFDQDDVVDPDELGENLPAANALITDAAHGFWSGKNTLLITTSCYSKTLLSWSPVLVAYSNGQTTKHYQRFFSVLIHSVVEDGERRGFSIDDMMHWGLGGVSKLQLTVPFLTWNDTGGRFQPSSKERIHRGLCQLLLTASFKSTRRTAAS